MVMIYFGEYINAFKCRKQMSLALRLKIFDYEGAESSIRKWLSKLHDGIVD